jgi:polysaccharide export outer membrane protein
MSRSITILILVLCFLSSCIPLRKQFYLIDKRKPSVEAIQRTDTVIYTVPFEYKIRKGDHLSISVSNLQFDAANGVAPLFKPRTGPTQNINNSSGGQPAQNDDSFLVNDSGYVNLPFIGSVLMSGLSLEEAESKINKIASKYFNHTVTNIRIGFNYTLVLLNSGIIKTSINSKLTLLEVITQASIPDFGNLRRIKIIRRTNGNNGYHIYYVDINDQSIVSKPEFYILPNDIIVVEAYRLKNFNQYFVRNIGLVTTFISVPLLVFSLLNTYKLTR